MRIAIFSDPQGNAAALTALLKVLEARAPDRVYVLGDLVGRGPRPRKVIDLIAEHGFARVRGHGDTVLVGEAGDRTDPVVRSAGRLLRKRDHAFLAAAPETMRDRFEGVSVFFAHGADASFAPLVSRWTPPEVLAPIFERREADVIVLGAPEDAFVREVGARLIVNTGSVGCPIQGDPRATFAILEFESGKPPRAEVVRVPYALAKTTRRVEKNVRRERLLPELAIEYQLALLGKEEAPEPELHPKLTGADLTVALLARRIARVYAVAAGPWPEDDLEHVHGLRVATRRLREALALAAPLLPSIRRLDRRAQRLGRTLGLRRTLDVFIERVRRARDGGHPGLEGFVGLLQTLRDDATARVRAAYPREKLVAHGLALLSRSMEGISGRTLDERAAAHLEARAEKVDQRLPAIELEDAGPAHHGLRIALKHLRYAFEILAPAYPDAIDPAATVAPIKALQDALGTLNDQVELIALANERLAEGAPSGEAEDLAKFVGALEVERAATFEQAKAEVSREVPKILAEAHAVAAVLRRDRP